jgi:hypothetical protein
MLYYNEERARIPNDYSTTHAALALLLAGGAD